MSAPLKPVLAGNWKMNLGPSEAARFFEDFLAVWQPQGDRSVVFSPPAVSFAAARDAVRGRADVRLGVQNVHWEAGGAFTGETSVSMAADAGAELVLIGHSERRWVFGETTDETVKKVRAVLDGGLVPVLCVGEKIEEREAGETDAVVVRQLRGGLSALGGEYLHTVIIAYEPVWAIGTGRTATPQDASSAHAAIRAELRLIAGKGADEIPILYGGSVNVGNASALLAAPGVDGLLVGGASLEPEGWATICGA